MSQVKAKKHISIYIEQTERYVFMAVLLVLVAGVVYVGFFFNTGKGWLLLERKETMSDFYFNEKNKQERLSALIHTCEQF